MQLTLEKVRQALSERTDLCYVETVKQEPGIRLDNPKTFHAVPYGGIYEFKVWPKQPSKNTEYLNKIFESLPGYTKSYEGDPYHAFRYRDGNTLYFPHPYSINEPLGTYEHTLTFSITDEGFGKKLEGIPNTFTDSGTIYNVIWITFIPAEGIGSWAREEQLALLPDYPNETMVPAIEVSEVPSKNEGWTLSGWLRKFFN
jgi:hypothetical protein